MTKKKHLQQEDEQSQLAAINTLLSPSKITTYEKAQTIEKMIAKLPEARINKESSKRNINTINHTISDSLNRYKLLQEEKESLLQEIQAMNLEDCLPLNHYDLPLDYLPHQTLKSCLPLINALRHVQNTKVTPEELLDSVFVRKEEEQFESEPLVISKDQQHPLSYNLLAQVRGQLRLVKALFDDDCHCSFACKPHPNDLQLRADIFAKLFLNYQKIEIEEEKMVKDDQQDTDKFKEEKVDDEDLGAEVARLLEIIYRKTNEKSFQLFKLKQYAESTDAKAKYERLIKEVEELDTNMARLKKIHLFKSENNY